MGPPLKPFRRLPLGLMPVAAAMAISACGGGRGATDPVGLGPAAAQSSPAAALPGGAGGQGPVNPVTTTPGAAASPTPSSPPAKVGTTAGPARPSTPATSGAPVTPGVPAVAATGQCPSGAPVGEITFSSAIAQVGVGGDLTVWLVVARGTVKNTASAAIQMPGLDVRFGGTGAIEISTASLERPVLDPGSSTKWATTTITQSGTKPVPALALAGKWAWSDPALRDRCPTA